MRGIRLLFSVFCVCGMLFLEGCGTDPIAGGTSTSENGRVIGKIIAADGSIASHAQVMLIPAAFNPVRNSVAIPTDTTDVSGDYSFSHIAAGDYSVESVDFETRSRALRCSVHVADDTVTLSDDTLRKPGSINITLSDDIDAASGYVYIPGTTIFAKCSEAGTSVVLDSVPSGIIPSVVYASDDTVQTSVLRYEVPVRPEESSTIRNTGWKYSKRLRLNTSASGANSKQTIYRFPVLVRLTGNNFDFSQARYDGADLLFTKQNDTFLPFEIERWDAGKRKAEIWVLVDTLPGNDSSNSIIIYWGNPQADNNSDGAAVFDTAAGFRGVWHLGENSDTLYDATINRFHGSRHGEVEPSLCMIGYGQTFDSNETYCEMGNVLNPGGGDLTISAWVKRSATGLQTIMAKSNGGKPNASYGWSLSFGTTDQLHFFTATAGPSWGSSGAFDFWSKEEAPVTDLTVWHYVVAVIDRSDNTRCRTYIDGVDVTGGSNGDITQVGELVTTVPLRIGAEADNECQWTGSIDECVISGTARSEAWIRMCYLNQGPDDRLVEFIREW